MPLMIDRDRIRFVVAAAFLCVFVAGCGGSSVSVSGNVTLNGEPVSEGDIIFRTDKEAAAGKIKDGAYTLQAPRGESRVEITAYRETGEIDRSNPGVEAPRIEMYIPEKYNVRTTLSADTNSGERTFDFPLDGKAR